MILLYVIDASHKAAIQIGVPVDDGLAESVHEIPADGVIIEVAGKLLCFVPVETE